MREEYCNSVPGGSFKNVIEEISEILSDVISMVLEIKWGYLAIHPGVTPGEFIKSGGNENGDHIYVIYGMKDSAFIVEKQELK